MVGGAAPASAVKWIATRNESFLSDTQGRDCFVARDAGLTTPGTSRPARQHARRPGAYVSSFGAAIPGPIDSALLAGVYRTPAVFVEVNGFSATAYRPTPIAPPVGPRLLRAERLADKAARLGIAGPRSAAAT